MEVDKVEAFIPIVVLLPKSSYIPIVAYLIYAILMTISSWKILIMVVEHFPTWTMITMMTTVTRAMAAVMEALLIIKKNILDGSF